MSQNQQIEVEGKFIIEDIENFENRIMDLNGHLLGETSFTDSYWEQHSNKKYPLTLSDFWLRTRDGRYELKKPNERTSSSINTQIYEEIVSEDKIYQELENILNLNTSTTASNTQKEGQEQQQSPLEEVLKNNNFYIFAEFTTKRKKYKLDDFTIDIDESSTGYNVVEIELLCDDPIKTDNAVRRIDECAVQALKIDVKINERVISKIEDYLIKNDMDHYNALFNTSKKK